MIANDAIGPFGNGGDSDYGSAINGLFTVAANLPAVQRVINPAGTLAVNVANQQPNASGTPTSRPSQVGGGTFLSKLSPWTWVGLVVLAGAGLWYATRR